MFEDGVLCDEIYRIKKDEWRNGLQMEEYLHKTLIDVATPDMTFYWKSRTFNCKK